MNTETATDIKILNIETDAKKKRIWIFDFLRGLCVLLMVCDHLINDFIYILPIMAGWTPLTQILYNFGSFYWIHPVRVAVRAIVIIIFYLVCGICCSFSKSNIKRGLKLAGIAAAITAVTYTADIILGKPTLIIWFGTLHCLAIAILIVALIELIPKEKLKMYIYVLCGILIILPHLYTYAVAPFAETKLNIILGIHPISNIFFSLDIAPLSPNIGIVFLGVALGKFLKQRALLKPSAPPVMLRPVNAVGRRALFVYIIHQPILVAILYLLVLIF